MENRRFLKHFAGVQGRIRAYFLTVTGSIADAEDLFQETACLLWEKFDQYDDAREFLPWTFGFARRVALRWRRRRQRSRILLSGESIEVFADRAVTLEQLGTDENMITLENCLNGLRDKARNLIQLRYGDGMRIKAIAERLKRSVGAVEVTLVRIRRVLRDCVEKKLARVSGA